MAQAAESHKADHLCVLVHGLWGNPSHLDSVVKAIRDKYTEDELCILVAKRNSGSFTYDGIELGGERVCKEIEEEIERLEASGQKIKKLSVVGYSLGGVISRYAIGLLETRGLFEKVEPVNFTTFATPHLGVRTPLRGWHNHIWNVMGARLLSMSGRQLFIIDNFRDTGRPLLSILGDSNSIFIKGLAKFKRRTLYSNIVNDRSAVYYTTGISKTDPFTDPEEVKINYLKGTEDVIVDIENPVSPKEKPEVSTAWYSRIFADGRSLISRLPLMIALMIFIPFGLVAFLINCGIQTITSSRRIRLHETGRAGFEISTYRMPILLQGVRGAVEDVYENLNSSQGNEYLTSGGEEEGVSHSEPVSPRKETLVESDSSDSTEKIATPNVSTDDEESRPTTPHIDSPMLALAPDQFAMIQALDGVGWRKYPVHIHKVGHSHAAIVVRTQKPAFSEGWIVLRHWMDNEFLM